MVASPLTLASYAALAASCFSSNFYFAAGAPLDSNPTTPLRVAALTASHPAYGAKLKGDVVQPVIKFDPNEARAKSLPILDGPSPNTTQRYLHVMENADSDISKLEDHFKEPMERNFNVLKADFSSGASKTTPWPGSYWPMYQDGINAVWNAGEPSASEKFARAYDKDVKQFQDSISSRSGIQTQSGNQVCTSNANCDNLGDGSACAIRAGQSSGYCIPTWYGICHAWAPAAELEPEPKCATKVNGITFQPMDIKALMTQVYNDAYVDVVFLGARFDGPDSPLNLDKYGRFTNPERRDIGAGLFHIGLTNILGKRSQSFILDVAAGSEVWNQPVSKYEVVEARLVDPVQASRTYYRTPTYPFNADMKNLAHMRTRVSWIVEATEDGPLVSNGRVGAYTNTVEYEYFLELDDKLNIIGGEWLGESNQNHPDFLWFAKGAPRPDTVTDLGMSYKDIRALLDASIACQDKVPGPTPTTAKPTPTPTPTTATPSTSPAPAPTTPAPVTHTPTPSSTRTPAPNSQAPAPVTQAPVTQAPVTQAPVTQAPVTQAPVTQAPITQAPVTPAPKTPVPVTQAPLTPAPTTSAPVTQAPVTQSPVTQAPISPAPKTPTPVTQSPV
ncbi:Elicitor-like transglutaminase, partial [Globisporangium polare]